MNDRKETTLRMNINLYRDIHAIAEQENANVNQTIETACKYYRDYYHMGKKSTFINDELLKVLKSNSDYLLDRVNHKTNQVLSELAIQNAIQNILLSNELEVDNYMMDEFRKQAIDFLKSNNRVLRMDELT